MQLVIYVAFILLYINEDGFARRQGDHMQFLQTDDIEFKSLAKMAYRITEYRQPNRFFTGLVNGVILSLTAWGGIYAMMVWMF
jgi:hypothetical protein